MSRAAIYRLAILMVLLGTLALMLGGDPWGPT
jgi:hypothetical protein